MTINDLVPGLGRGHLPVRREVYDPFRDLRQEMNRLFDDFPLAPQGGGREFSLAGFSPRVDVSETEKEIKVSAELPGMDEKDIAVEMDEAGLTLRGEKKEEKGRNWYCREQSYGSFQRNIPLPAGVETEKIKATFKKGVLTILVPKKEEEQAKRKAIKVESA